MRSMLSLLSLGCAAVSLLCGAPAVAQSNVIWPNDDCAFATPISGQGYFAFDTGSPYVTTSLPPLPSTCPGCSCGTVFTGIESDLWFLWTSTCTGVVEIKTGTQTDPPGQCNLDTVLAIYNTPCPGPTGLPIACCDDTCAAVGNTCDLASYVSLDVQCNQKYLIRIGKKPGTPGGYGTLKIACTGTECPPPAEGSCPNCCGGKPQFDDPFYTTNYTGQVAIMTGNDSTNGPSAYNVVTIFNLACSSPPPVPGMEWNPVSGAPTTAFRYSRNNWTKGDLGSVFGLTLDGQGSIYAAHTSIYGILGGVPSTCIQSASAIGSTPLSSSTSVYKLAAGSGTQTVFVNLPGGSSSVTDPGLGNVTYDCTHEEFFVSHFGDGRIYRVDQSGSILGWYDHATNTVGIGSTPEGPPTTYRDYVPLGERVWAVQVHDGRLYYSVWGQNKDSFVPTAVVGTTPNRVWSIALAAGAGGNFVAGSRQQEVQTPVHPGNTYAPASVVQFSEPVSDISFSPTCRMLLAEHDMSIDNCTLAHSARALEYGLNGTWQPTNYRSGYGYQIGQSDASLQGTNSAGGCDYDFTPVDTCAAGRLWLTGDALIYNTTGGRVYGMAGVDTSTAFGYTSSLLVDYNAYYGNGSFDKTKQGDVELPCVLAHVPCLTVTNQKILCPVGDGTGGTGCYTWTFSVTNKTGFSVKYITVPLHPTPNSPITLQPNVINLLLQDGSLLDPGETTTVSVQICGGLPGDEFCINLGMVTPQFVECCFEEVCLVLPACDCGQLRDQHISSVYCSGAGLPQTVSFTYCFTLDNLGANPVDQVIFIPFDSRQGYFFKDFWFLPPLLPGGSQQMCVQVLNAIPGEEFCFYVLMQHPGEDCCCAFEKCVTVPVCPDQFNACDFDHNGTVDGSDLGQMLGNWGPCKSCAWDLNHDGIVDGADLGVLLGWWTG